MKTELLETTSITVDPDLYQPTVDPEWLKITMMKIRFDDGKVLYVGKSSFCVLPHMLSTVVDYHGVYIMESEVEAA